MLSQQEIEQAARDLHEAERQRRQIRPLTIRYPDMDLADAYAVQDAWMAIKLAEGRSAKGRKIGLTSRAMQQAMQIDEPDTGLLLDDMFFDSGAPIEASQFTDPRLEVELAFILGQPLSGPDVTLTDVLNATSHVMPAVEIIAARSFRIDPETGKPRTVRDTIADNAANAGLVLGGRPMRPMDLDLRWASALLFKNGVIEESGVAASVLNHPANGLVWLVRRLAGQGLGLASGEVVLSGSFTRPVLITAGDSFHADFGGLGSFAVEFA